MSRDEPIHFHTERRRGQLTGLAARSAPELLAILQELSGLSVSCHTHRLCLSHHFVKPAVQNDFADWV